MNIIANLNRTAAARAAVEAAQESYQSEEQMFRTLRTEDAYAALGVAFRALNAAETELRAALGW